MDNTIVVALISAASALITAIISIALNNRVINFQIKALAEKVDKHNHLIERMAIVERDEEVLFRYRNEMMERLDKLESKGVAK